ncbi:MAG: hypothetical protein ABIR35_01775 [Polaromonas sp.]
MKAVIGRERYLALALGAISLILLSVLLWEWEQGKNLERDLLKMRKLPATAVPAQKILPEFSLPDKETGFPELLSRPVFSVSRRPSGLANKDAGAMKKGQFALVGVLISPGQRSALLRDVATSKTETVPLIGVVRGLTLGDVQSDRVVLRQGAESEELMLNVLTGPKLPVAPKNPAAPPALPIPATPAPPAVPPTAKPASAPASAPVALPAASAPQAGATPPQSPVKPLAPPAVVVK